MRGFRLTIDQLELQWDREYGIFKRDGWSVGLDGSFLVQLERWLIVVVVKGVAQMGEMIEAGRAIDALVAKEVFGLIVAKSGDPDPCPNIYDFVTGTKPGKPPLPCDAMPL